MSILRNMTEIEFNQYIDKAIENYAKEKINSGNWNQEEALYKSKEEYTSLLPYGEKTKDNYLFSIVDEDEVVGMIWLSKKNNVYGFIYDINVLEVYRGKGYGKYAMKEVEIIAKNLGLEKIELHVFGHNETAINLYEKLGYKATNILMSKKIK